MKSLKIFADKNQNPKKLKKYRERIKNYKKSLYKFEYSNRRRWFYAPNFKKQL